MPPDDHSWVGDYVNSNLGYRHSNTAAGAAGRQVRQNRQASEKWVRDHQRKVAKHNKDKASSLVSTSSQNSPSSGTAALSYQVTSLIDAISVIAALVILPVAIWITYVDFPEIAHLEPWKRAPAAAGIGFLTTGLVYGAIRWTLSFTITVLLPLLIRLAMFAAVVAAIVFGAQMLLGS